MKSKYLFAGVVILISLVLVSAITGVIQTDKFWSDSALSKPVKNVQEIIYTCEDSTCSSQGELVHNFNTGNSNIGEFEYPYNSKSTESNPDYYAHFSFADCYLPKEYIEWAWGYGVTVEYDYKMNKAKNCHAPIDSFSVTNRNYVNEPVIIDMITDLNAETQSAFTDLELDWFPKGYEDYYSAETEAVLKIYNSEDEVVYTDFVDLNILMDTSEEVHFEWTPKEEGEYRARITTDVTDCQCSSSFEEYAEKVFTVWPERPANECYTLINNLIASPDFPFERDLVTIKYDKISNYADEEHVKTPIPTRVDYEIKKGDETVFSDNLLLDANPNDIDAVEFDFKWTPEEGGFYDIIVTGVGESGLCSGKTNPEDTVSISYFVEGLEEPEPACYKDSDCGINGFIGEKYCSSGDVYRNYREYSCNNPGKINAYCSNNIDAQLIEECEYGCSQGECLPEPKDCEVDSDCGEDYYGNKYCEENNVVRDHFIPICTIFGTCDEEVETELIEECEYGCRDGRCIKDKERDKRSSGVIQLFTECVPIWECGDWSACYDGIKTRNCEDINRCEFTIDKPIERVACSEDIVMQNALEDEKIKFNWFWLWIGGIIFLILAIILVLLIRDY